jgi:hypothetical protein
MGAGDSVEMEARQESGGDLGIQVADHSPRFTLTWLGPA